MAIPPRSCDRGGLAFKPEEASEMPAKACNQANQKELTLKGNKEIHSTCQSPEIIFML